MSKTLGQVAFEAHCGPPSAWRRITAFEREQWQAAAEAVALATVDEVKVQMKTMSAYSDAREAVIEAAKAALLGGTLGRVLERTKSVWDQDALSDLLRNTEALVSEEE